MGSSVITRRVWTTGKILAASFSVFYFCGCAMGGGSMGGGSSGGTPVATNSVSMQSLSFVPQNILVTAGSTVTWTNNDNTMHSVTADPKDPVAGGPNSDGQFPNGIQPGQAYSWPVPAGAASGTVWYYHCRFHGAPGNGTSLGTGMAGSVTVQ